jgi:hypothetical protein
MCTQYLHHIHLSTPCPHLLLTPICTNLSPPPPWPREDLFHSPVLQFCKRKKNYIFTCLRLLHREFPCDISMYTCIIAPVGSSLFFFYFFTFVPFL